MKSDHRVPIPSGDPPRLQQHATQTSHSTLATIRIATSCTSSRIPIDIEEECAPDISIDMKDEKLHVVSA